MSAVAPYRASLNSGGQTPGTAPNVTTQYQNVATAAANTGSGVLHVAIGVILIAIVLLLIGSGWLSNAKL